MDAIKIRNTPCPGISDPKARQHVLPTDRQRVIALINYQRERNRRTTGVTDVLDIEHDFSFVQLHALDQMLKHKFIRLMEYVLIHPIGTTLNIFMQNGYKRGNPSQRECKNFRPVHIQIESRTHFGILDITDST